MVASLGGAGGGEGGQYPAELAGEAVEFGVAERAPGAGPGDAFAEEVLREQLASHWAGVCQTGGCSAWRSLARLQPATEG